VAIFGALFLDACIEGMRLIAFKICSEDAIILIP